MKLFFYKTVYNNKLFEIYYNIFKPGLMLRIYNKSDGMSGYNFCALEQIINQDLFWSNLKISEIDREFVEKQLINKIKMMQLYL